MCVKKCGHSRYCTHNIGDKHHGHQPQTPIIQPFCVFQLSPGSEEDDHEGPVCEKLGRIQFSVGYSFQDSTLTVKILKGQDLPAKDFSGTSDPFVKLYLLPDKKHKLETKVKRKNLNPHWNETFLFEGLMKEAFTFKCEGCSQHMHRCDLSELCCVNSFLRLPI